MPTKRRTKHSDAINDADAQGKPEVADPTGLKPKKPRGGWTFAKVPGSIWTAFELDYMTINLPLYRARKGEARSKLVYWVRKQIHKKWGARYNDAACKDPKILKEWRKRKKSIGDWFGNHGRSETEVRIPHWTGKATFHQVMVAEKRVEIQELTDVLSNGAKRGVQGGEWIRHYQKAVKQIREGLSEDEKAVIHDKMARWDASCVPEAEQARQAATRAAKTLSTVHKMCFKTMGMRCITLMMHYDESGTPVNAVVDSNDRLVKPECGRVTTMRGWNSENMEKIAELWVEYITKVILPAERPEMLGDDIRKGLAPPRMPIKIQRLENGHYLIPDAHEREVQADKKTIIREFLNLEYKLATNGGARSIPWTIFETQTAVFVDAEYLPANVAMKDPEKMAGSDRTLVLEHWRRRQALGQPALIFNKISVAHQMIPARYQDNLATPEPTDCVAVHTPLPPAVEDTDSEDDVQGLEDYNTDHPSSNSSSAEDEHLDASEVRPSITGKGVRKRKGLQSAVKRIKRVVQSSDDEAPPAAEAMPTPEATPPPAVPGSQITPKPRPKPKQLQRDRGTLQRELRGLGTVIPEIGDDSQTARSSRRSPEKAKKPS